MNIAFYLHGPYLPDGTETQLGRRAVASARKMMPNATILQLAGHNFLDIGADDVVFMKDLNRYEHQSLVPGETLFLDVDVIVQKDVSNVFNDDFDAAFCLRSKFDVNNPPSPERRPYNGGVVFARTPEFWRVMATYWETAGRPIDDIFLGHFIAKGLFNVKNLPGVYYNYTPQIEGEDVSDKAIVHYKGVKKPWMLAR